MSVLKSVRVATFRVLFGLWTTAEVAAICAVGVAVSLSVAAAN